MENKGSSHLTAQRDSNMDSLHYGMWLRNRETQLPEGSIIETSKKIPLPNKMFIGGITSQISKQALFQYLSKFGPIADFIIKTYPGTAIPRHFGFVLFKDSSTVEKVLQVEKHVVSGKEIHLERAKVMEPKYSNRKVFVGGLNPQVPRERILQYFGKFGKIESLQIPMCKTKNERRPFCFITYTDESSVRKLLEHRFHYIGVESCEVKLTGWYRNPNPQQRAEGNAPFFGLAGWNGNPNSQQRAQGNAPFFRVAGCNRKPNPQQRAERNAAFFGVAKPYGDGEFLGNPNAFFVNQNDYGAVGGGQGLPVAPVPEPFGAYNPEFAFPRGAYDHFYNGYTKKPGFNSYSGQYFHGHDNYNYATGADCKEETNQADTDCHGHYRLF